MFGPNPNGHAGIGYGTSVGSHVFCRSKENENIKCNVRAMLTIVRYQSQGTGRALHIVVEIWGRDCITSVHVFLGVTILREGDAEQIRQYGVLLVRTVWSMLYFC